MTKTVKDIWICKEDAEHHTAFLGTASSKDKGVYCPSPLEVVKYGAENSDYLDRFPIESQWYEDIQRFKAETEFRSQK